MNKPNDISQEAWDAVALWAEWYVADPFRSVEETIARAIMAAALSEREACALLIDEGFDRVGVKSKNDKCPHDRYGWEDCEQCASYAIRKRGD